MFIYKQLSFTKSSDVPILLNKNQIKSVRKELTRIVQNTLKLKELPEEIPGCQVNLVVAGIAIV